MKGAVCADAFQLDVKRVVRILFVADDLQDASLCGWIVELADPPLVDAEDFGSQQIVIRIHLIRRDFCTYFVPFPFGGIVFAQEGGRINGMEWRDVDDGFPLVELSAVVAVLRDVLIVDEPLVQQMVVTLLGDEIFVADVAVMKRNGSLAERFKVVASSTRSTYVDQQIWFGLFETVPETEHALNRLIFDHAAATVIQRAFRTHPEMDGACSVGVLAVEAYTVVLQGFADGFDEIVNRFRIGEVIAFRENVIGRGEIF